MKFKVIGLVVVLGLGLTGCSGETATDDLTNCRDAHNARELYATEYMTTPDDKISEINASLSEKLADISDRTSSVEIADALRSDSSDLDDPNYDQFFGIERFKFNSVCMLKYSTSFMVPE